MAKTPNVAQLIPGVVAHVLFGATGRDDVLSQIGRCGVAVGSNTEIDTGTMIGVAGEELTAELISYDAQCREFFDAWVAGEPTGPYVVVRRELRRARQQDSKAGRSDLTGELEACGQVPGLEEIVDEACSANPDWSLLQRNVEALAGSLNTNGNTTVLTMVFEVELPWPSQLGGPATRGEVAREFSVTVNHAAWRDRKNRRLVEIAIEAIEVWPEPHAEATPDDQVN